MNRRNIVAFTDLAEPRPYSAEFNRVRPVKTGIFRGMS